MLKYHSLRDKVFGLKNLYAAFQHVKKNKGKAGLDRVSIKQFEANLDVNIASIHQEPKTVIYKPSPNSYGFRQNRCCHDAIKRLEQYKQDEIYQTSVCR